MKTDHTDHLEKNRQFDVFISYKHEDMAFAARIHKRLSRYKPPAGIVPHRRMLKVFRDESDMAGVEYFASIDKALRGSAKLLVICSPSARGSEYINDEIHRFVSYRDANNIIPVIIRGVPNNEAAEKESDERAFPDALCETLEMPLAVDYRDYDVQNVKLNRGRYKNEWFKLLANILDVKREEIEQREEKRFRQRLAIATALVSGVIIILSVLAAVAWIQKREAQHQRNIAISQLMLIDGKESLNTRPDRSLLLSVAATRINPSSNARDLLMTSVLHKNRLERYLTTGGRPWVASTVSDHAGYVFSATKDSRLELHRTNDPASSHTVIGETAGVTAVALAPSNSIAAVGTLDGDVQIWDLAGAKQIHLLKGKINRPISELAFSPDSHRLIVGAAYTDTYLWDVETGSRLAQLDQHKSGPQAMVFHNNGSLMATGAENGRVIVWRFDAAISHFALEDPRNSHSGFIYALAFSPDGKCLVSAGADRKILLWDLETRKVKRTLLNKENGETTTALRFDPQGNRLAIASENGIITILKLDGYAKKTILDASPIKPTDIAFSEDGDQLVVTGIGTNAMRFDLSDTPRFALPLKTNGRGLGPMVFSQDGRRIATLDCKAIDPTSLSCTGQEISVWEIDEPHPVAPPVELATYPRAFCFTKDGDQLVIVEPNKQVTIRDIETGRVVSVSTPPQPPPPPDTAMGGSADHGRIFRRVAFEVPVAGRIRPVMGVGPGMSVSRECSLTDARIGPNAFSADGQRFAFAGAGCIFLWNMDSGWSAEPVLRHINRIRSLGLSKNGAHLAIGKSDGGFIVQHLTPDGPHYAQQIAGRGITINAMSFNPEGTMLAVVGGGAVPSDEEHFIQRFEESGFLSVWQIVGEPILYARSAGFPSAVNAVAFNRDGKTIAVGHCHRRVGWFCQGGAIELWDVPSRKPLGLAIPAHRDDVYHLLFSPKNDLLISRSRPKGIIGGDERILSWDLSTSHWMKTACAIANRDFTSEESEDYFVDIYGQPCEGL